jgi:hypothetical protein
MKHEKHHQEHRPIRVHDRVRTHNGLGAVVALGDGSPGAQMTVKLDTGKEITVWPDRVARVIAREE